MPHCGTGFVGEASNKPIPLSEDEVLALGMEKHEIEVRYNVLAPGTLPRCRIAAKHA